MRVCVRDLRSAMMIEAIIKNLHAHLGWLASSFLSSPFLKIINKNYSLSEEPRLWPPGLEPRR